MIDTDHPFVIVGKAAAFQTSLDSVLTYLEKNGLASIPLLPLPDATTTAGGEKAEDATTAEGGESIPKPPAETTKADAGKGAESSSTLDSDIANLQQQAKDLFDRRQRLKESASIVSGILDS